MPFRAAPGLAELVDGGFARLAGAFVGVEEGDEFELLFGRAELFVELADDFVGWGDFAAKHGLQGEVQAGCGLIRSVGFTDEFGADERGIGIEIEIEVVGAAGVMERAEKRGRNCGFVQARAEDGERISVSGVFESGESDAFADRFKNAQRIAIFGAGGAVVALGIGRLKQAFEIAARFALVTHPFLGGGIGEEAAAFLRRADVNGGVRPEAGQAGIGEIPVAAFEQNITGLEFERGNLIGCDQVAVGPDDLGISHPFGNAGLDGHPGSEAGLAHDLKGIGDGEDLSPPLPHLPDAVGVFFEALAILRGVTAGVALVDEIAGGELDAAPGVQEAKTESGVSAVVLAEIADGFVENFVEGLVAGNQVKKFERVAVLNESGAMACEKRTRPEGSVQPVIALMRLANLLERELKIEETLPGGAEGFPLVERKQGSFAFPEKIRIVPDELDDLGELVVALTKGGLIVIDPGADGGDFGIRVTRGQQ